MPSVSDGRTQGIIETDSPWHRGSPESFELKIIKYVIFYSRFFREPV